MFNSQLRIIDQLSKGYREREGVGGKDWQARSPPSQQNTISLPGTCVDLRYPFRKSEWVLAY